MAYHCFEVGILEHQHGGDGHMPTEFIVEVTDRRVLGLEAAAAYLDTTPRTIQRLIARGILTPVNIPTLRRVLLDRRDLDSLIDLGKGSESRRESGAAHA
jgi:hypothetical protein